MEELLRTAQEEEDRLRRDLETLVPVKLNFNVPGDDAPRAPYGSMDDFNPEILAADKAEVEAAWENHVKVRRGTSDDSDELVQVKVHIV